MIPTIVSRCQRFDFRKLKLNEIIKQLKYISDHEKIKIDDQALEVIALNAEGSLRDAISLLDEVITFSGSLGSKIISKEDIQNLLGLVDIAAVVKFIDLLFEKKPQEALDFIDEIINKGYDLHDFIKKTIEYLRKALILKIHPQIKRSFLVGLSDEEIEKLKKQIENKNLEDLKKIIYILIKTSNEMRYSPFYQLPLELAVLEITSL
jgi:DNA polymerase-3 subunit gamma/tau